VTAESSTSTRYTGDMKIYGIKTCDTCRKARRFLTDNEIDHDWHDMREDGLKVATVQRWLKKVGVETLVNRRSTTWRNLNEVERVEAMAEISSAAVLTNNPTLIKRPVIDLDGDILVGFSSATQEKLLAGKS